MSKTKEELIFDYLNSSLNLESDSDKYIDAMLSISSTSSALGGEVAGLLSSLNAMQRHRLQSLQKEFKHGLSEYEKPLGSLNAEALHCDFLHYVPKDEKSKRIEAFLTNLEIIYELNDEEQQALLIRELKKVIKEYKNTGIYLKNYITTQNQKNVWNRLVFNDTDKMDKFELDDLLLKMKLAVTKHSKKLKEISDYFTTLEKIEGDFVEVTSSFLEPDVYFKVREKYKMDKALLEKPKTRELVAEVDKFKDAFENKIEHLPQHLNDEQKAIVSDFLPMLCEYYEDQCCAFVGGKKYLPMAKDLQEFHDSIDSLYIMEFLVKSDKLGYTMQHLYLLHWVGEELMKKLNNLNLTLGRSINKRQEIHRKKNKELLGRYNKFMTGVIFRNNVAHNGIIWEPTGFEDAINRYKKGIVLLGEDFSTDLAKEPMPKRHEEKFSKKEKEKIKNVKERSKQDEFSKIYFDKPYNEVKDALHLYNTSLEKVSEDVSLSSYFRPACNTFYYLYKTYENDLKFQPNDNGKIERIKDILKEQ